MMSRGNMGKQIATAPASKKMAKGGKAFKPCSECPSPAKCKAAGKCMMKSKK
jgi:hypothetical protein